MLADCLAGDRRFGITRSGGEREAPDAGAVGCVAEVRANEQLPDGRSNVLILGIVRFVVRRVLADPAPYHVGLVEEFEEEDGTAPRPESVDELRVLFLRYYHVLRLLNDADPDEPALPEEPLPLSFAVAAAVECDIGLKRRLLATRSTDERVRLLLRLLPELTANVESALGIHRGAHQNGKGGMYPMLPSDL